MKRILTNIIKIGVPFLLGALLFVFLYSKLDTAQIKEILQSGIDYNWVVLSVFISSFAMLFRAMRWRMQLRTLGVNPTLRSLTNAVYGTYALNIVFPRLGEVWRCGYVAKREGLSFTQVLGSVLSDRFCDTIAVLSIAAVAFVLQMRVLVDFFTQFPQLEQAIKSMVTSPWLYLICVLLIGGIYWLFKYRSQSAFIQRVKGVGRNLWNGFATVLRMEHKWSFLLCTVAIWICYFMQLYLCFFAFTSTEHLGIEVALALFAVGSLSMGIPVQAGLGTWHVAIIATLVLYGVDENQAGAFALVAHGAQMLMLVVMGIYAAFSIALDKRRSN